MKDWFNNCGLSVAWYIFADYISAHRFFYKCKTLDARSKLTNITFCINKCNTAKWKYGVKLFHELECTLYKNIAPSCITFNII